MSFLLTKLRGLYRVMADGAALPDVPAINFIAGTSGTIGASYNAAKNRIDVTLPIGSMEADPLTYVVRTNHGDIAVAAIEATDIVAAQITTTGDATIGGGLGLFGATPPSVKPTITGSRSSATVAVLAQLLTDLAAAGIIKDSTTS